MFTNELFYHKVFDLKKLKQISVVGLGLLGGSITLGVSRCFSGVKTVGYSHRPSTREKARKLSVADLVTDDLCECVEKADIVILATPILTFEQMFKSIKKALPDGCIVTDVGSTKSLAHSWAKKQLPKNVFYVGSHPIAGSEQRGVEFARDDLFDKALCILTSQKNTNPQAVKTLAQFWTRLGCCIEKMTPAQHDRVFAMVSHVPHILAASLINTNTSKDLKFSGKGFMDTSRIASGPENIWSDILLTNPANTAKGIEKLINELNKIKNAILADDKTKLEKLLKDARQKRTEMLKYKMTRKELIS